jgi:hypothetical protein
MAATTNEEVYAFAPEDQWLVDEVQTLLREVMQQAELTPRQIFNFGLLLNALERLPRVTPGTWIDFSIEYSFNHERTWIDLHLNEDSFSLGDGFSVYDPQIGSDHSTSDAFSVEPGGFRSNPSDTPEVLGWFAKSRELLSLNHKIEITHQGDLDTIIWAEDDDDPFDWSTLGDDEQLDNEEED